MASSKTPGPFGAPDPATDRARDALEELLRDAPPISTVDINAMRRLRAEGGGALPVHGPTSAGVWRPLTEAPPGAPDRIRVVDPGDARAVYLNIHGGGWTFGGAEFFDERAEHLARATRALVASASYRLAPEHPWPACFEDCARALDAAIALADEMGGVPLAIGGDSAGAQLAAATLLRLRDQGRLARVCGAVFIYGCFDLRLTPSARNWGARFLVLSTPTIEWFVGNLLPDRSLAETPAVSPLLADLEGMPPALLQVGDEDPLLDDSLFLYERWKAAGGVAELVGWPGAWHGFDYFLDPSHGLPIAAESLQRTADFLTRRFDEADRRPRG